MTVVPYALMTLVSIYVLWVTVQLAINDLVLLGESQMYIATRPAIAQYILRLNFY